MKGLGQQGARAPLQRRSKRAAERTQIGPTEHIAQKLAMRRCRRKAAAAFEPAIEKDHALAAVDNKNTVADPRRGQWVQFINRQGGALSHGSVSGF